jgi:hypothetical protein
MFEKQGGRLWKLKKGIQARRAARAAEKATYKGIYQKEYKRLETGFIRKRARADLKRKYARPSLTSGWRLPKPGEESVGERMQRAMAGLPPRKKGR